NEPIVVIITPNRGEVSADCSDQVALSDLGETAISVVAIQKQELLRRVSNDQVKESIIVNIAPGAAFRGSIIVDDLARGDPCKASVAVISEQRIISPVVIGHKHVVQSVVIVVAPSHAT